MNLSTGEYVLMFIIILIFIAAIVIFLYYKVRMPAPITPFPLNILPPSSITSTLGASGNGQVFFNNGNAFTDMRSCNNNPNSSWNASASSTGQCTCLIPFYYDHCQLESYKNTYIAIGQIPDADLIKTEISTTQVDRLSFKSDVSDTVCTDLCDADENCIGVKWENSDCTLLADYIQFNTGVNPVYNLFEQSNYYLKNTYHPMFSDRVFLSAGVLPLRYWLVSNSYTSGNNHLNTLYEAIVYQIPYRPILYTNSAGTWIGLISNANISGNLNDLFNNPPEGVIPIPADQSDLNSLLPVGWNSVYAVFWDPLSNPII